METAIGRRFAPMCRGAVVVAALAVVLAGCRQEASSQPRTDGAVRSELQAAAGVTVEYGYDGAGNMTSARTSAAPATGITDFQPRWGTFGDEVVLSGQGFDPTPTKNIVQIGGVAAEVLSATRTSIAIRVPVGACTGRIFVTVGTLAMATPGNFVISQEMTITGITPEVGVEGTAVTITGAGFDPSPGGDRVDFSGQPGPVTAASAESLSTAAPPGVGSGPIRVTTRWGSVSSAADFIVAPKGVAAASVTVHQRLRVGTPVAYSSTAPGSTALYVYDAAKGSSLNLVVTNNTLGGWTTFKVFGPTGEEVYSTQLYAGSNGKSLIGTAPVAGTYTLLVAPHPTATGGAVVGVVENLVAPLLADGAAASANLEAGQDGYFQFDASAGDAFTLRATCGSTQATTLTVRKPSGAVVGSLAACSTSLDAKLDTGVLSESGAYTVTFVPVGVAGVPAQLRLWPYATSAIAIGGAPVSLDLAMAQNGRILFSGTAGDLLTFAATTATAIPAGTYVYVHFLNPDGTVLATTFTNSGGFTYALPALPVTGTYSVKVFETTVASTSLTALMSPLVAGTLAVDAGPATFACARPGQRARYEFTGSAGQSVTIRATADASFLGSVYVYGPTGAQFASALISTAVKDVKIDLTALAASGTYRVEVWPSGLTTGLLDLGLLPYVEGALLVGGPAQGWSLSAGQNGRLTFNGTQGDVLTIGVTPLATVPAGKQVYLYLSKPDGSSLTSSYGTSPFILALPALPATGTYAVRVVPVGPVAATGTIVLSGFVTGILTPGEAPTTFASARAGQAGRYLFDGAAGQSYTLRVTGDGVFTGRVYVYGPSGAAMGNVYVSTGAKDVKLDLGTLQATGTHLVEVWPAGVTTGSVSLSLYSYAVGAISIGGPAASMSLVAGQNGRLTFSGTAGDLLSFNVSRLTASPPGTWVTMSVNRPDGSLFTTTGGASPFASNFAVLPVTGSYAITVRPGGTAPAELTAVVSRR